VGVGIGGIEAERLFVVGGRLGGAAGLLERDAERGVGVGHAGIEAERLLVVLDGLLRTAGAAEGVGEIVVGVGGVGPEAKRGAVVVDGGGGLAGLEEHVAEIVLRALAVRTLGDGVAPDRALAAVDGVALRGRPAQPGGENEKHDEAPTAEPAVERPGHGDHHGCERQIQAVLDDHLDRTGDDARRRQDHEEPRAEEAGDGMAAERPEGRRDERDHDQRVGNDGGEVGRPRCGVVEDERVRPEGEAEVVGDGLELREPVRPGRDADAEADGATAVPSGGGDEDRERQPGGGMREVEAAALGPSASEASGDERAVEEEKEERGRWR
jgi:hypothetical protein